MATVKKKNNLYDSEEGQKIQQTLIEMVRDKAYNTGSTYSADSMSYPDNLIPFVDKHMGYLNSHPNLNPWQYVENLRLMTKIR